MIVFKHKFKDDPQTYCIWYHHQYHHATFNESLMVMTTTQLLHHQRFLSSNIIPHSFPFLHHYLLVRLRLRLRLQLQLRLRRILIPVLLLHHQIIIIIIIIIIIMLCCRTIHLILLPGMKITVTILVIVIVIGSVMIQSFQFNPTCSSNESNSITETNGKRMMNHLLLLRLLLL